MAFDGVRDEAVVFRASWCPSDCANRGVAPSLPQSSQNVRLSRCDQDETCGDPVVTGRGRRREPCGSGRVPAYLAGDALMMPV